MLLVDLLLVMLCGGLAWFLWSRARALEGGDPKRLAGAPDSPRIEELGTGGVLRLSGIGPDLEEFDLKVMERHRFRAGDTEWTELVCDRGSLQPVRLKMDSGREPALWLLHGSTASALGLQKADLERMEDKRQGEFPFQGVLYRYRASGQAVLYPRGEDRNAERYYRWVFDSADGRQVFLNAWNDGTLDGYLAEPLQPSQVTVYSLA